MYCVSIFEISPKLCTLVLIVAKCIVYLCTPAQKTKLFSVLIVAKCIVYQAEDGGLFKRQYVLIVAKCIVYKFNAKENAKVEEY